VATRILSRALSAFLVAKLAKSRKMEPMFASFALGISLSKLFHTSAAIPYGDHASLQGARKASLAEPYKPSGPRIEVTMSGGQKFVITTDPVRSPKTVKQILGLVKSGFYDQQRIHRVEDWVVQWGAPASRTQPMMVKGKDGKLELNPAVGDGDSGHSLPFEESTVDFLRGVVGIASNGLQMGGDCQLFVLKSQREYLFRSYAVVGRVTQGMETVDHLKFGDRIKAMRVLSAKSATKAGR
jgi:cyclophilin family peptidyl-prolyl cis-trans isomerase